MARSLRMCDREEHEDSQHNEAVLKITGEATDKGFSVTREEFFIVGEWILKSDLVFTSEEGAFVVDLTVRYESKGHSKMPRKRSAKS